MQTLSFVVILPYSSIAVSSTTQVPVANDERFPVTKPFNI